MNERERLLGRCPLGHVRAVRTTRQDGETFMELYCPTCETDGTYDRVAL